MEVTVCVDCGWPLRKFNFVGDIVLSLLLLNHFTFIIYYTIRNPKTFSGKLEQGQKNNKYVVFHPFTNICLDIGCHIVCNVVGSLEIMNF